MTITARRARSSARNSPRGRRCSSRPWRNFSAARMYPARRLWSVLTCGCERLGLGFPEKARFAASCPNASSWSGVKVLSAVWSCAASSGGPLTDPSGGGRSGATARATLRPRSTTSACRSRRYSPGSCVARGMLSREGTHKGKGDLSVARPRHVLAANGRSPQARGERRLGAVSLEPRCSSERVRV